MSDPEKAHVDELGQVKSHGVASITSEFTPEEQRAITKRLDVRLVSVVGKFAALKFASLC